MFGKIIYISDNVAQIEIPDGTPVAENLMNMHVIFEDSAKKILGEIEDIDAKIIKVRFLGEFVNGKFINGVIRKPTLSSTIRVITKEELDLVLRESNEISMLLGYSPLYDGYPITVGINELFSNHMAIFGNSGSGKSCGVARLLQNIFYSKGYNPVKSNFFIFDAYGEYHNAFKDINRINPNYQFKYYTTNKSANPENMLRIPLWLLTLDDYAHLLNADTHSQLTIIEKALKITKIFASSSSDAVNYKNHLIAKAITAVIYSNQSESSKRNEIFAIVNGCPTAEFHMEAVISGIGYTRKFKDCFHIDREGNFSERVLIGEYISNYIKEEYDSLDILENNFYTLNDLEKGLNFTLISEGLLQNEKMYNEAITLKVRLHSVAVGENKDYFSYPNYITLDEYIASLVSSNGTKAQIINFNLDDVEDGIAKVITKVYTRMLFEFTKKLPVRASVPFHIFLEEAHRYVQDDKDKFLIGYNIFERVAKEGRKYGLVLNLISQRPVELSETSISQCSNFLIFKMNHPRDLEYIKNMLPNISSEIIEKQKTLQPGTCVAFGKAFKIPMIVKMDMPNPAPHSSNSDVAKIWNS